MSKTTNILLSVLCVLGVGAAFIFQDSKVLFLIGTIELALLALVVNGFVIIYSRRNWRANPYGRAIMYSKISLAVFCNLNLLTVFLGPDWEWRPFLRVVLYGGILFAQARLLQLLFATKSRDNQRESRRTQDRDGKAI